MKEMIAEHIVSVFIAVIGFFLVRSLKKVDESISDLNKTTKSLDSTTDDLKLEMKDRPNWTNVKSICKEVSHAAISEHIINDHKGQTET